MLYVPAISVRVLAEAPAHGAQLSRDIERVSSTRFLISENVQLPAAHTEPRQAPISGHNQRPYEVYGSGLLGTVADDPADLVGVLVLVR